MEDATAMIRAAIVGLGRWGRSLVASVAGPKRRHPLCARGNAHALERRRVLPRVKKLTLVRPLRRRDSASSGHRRRCAGNTTQPARVCRRWRRPLHESTSSSRSHWRLNLDSARRIADAASRAGVVLAVGLELALSIRSTSARFALGFGMDGSERSSPWWASTPRRPRSSSRPATARGARRGAGWRLYGRRRARARPHDRVRRPGSRRALR